MVDAGTEQTYRAVRALDPDQGGAECPVHAADGPTAGLPVWIAAIPRKAVAAVSLAEPLAPRLGLLHGWAEPAAIVLITAALTGLTLVVGELAPKRIARQHPEAWALATAWPLSVLAAICRPAVWLLDAATNLVVRVAGVDPHRSRQDVAAGEIRDLVTAAQSFSARQRTINHGAFEIAERALRAVVVPVRDIIHADGPVAGHSRPALLLPDTLTACDALRHLRQQRQQMALVVDEQGGAEGIITLEDLVEEVVGEIDTDTDLQAVIHQSDGAMLLPHLRHIPTQPGAHVTVGRYTAGVTAVNRHAITPLRLHPSATTTRAPSHRRQPHRARPQEEAMSTTTRRPATASVLGEAVTKARTTPDLAVTGEVITGAAA